MRPKFNTVSSQPDLSCAILDWRCVLKFPHLNLSRAILNWWCVQSLILCLLSRTFLVQYWIEDASQNFSSIGPFSYNAELEMRPKFNAVSSQLDLSCAILDWRCVPKIFPLLDLSCAMLDWRCAQSLILCLLSWTFLVQYWIEDASQRNFLNWTFLVQCWIGDAPKV